MVFVCFDVCFVDALGYTANKAANGHDNPRLLLLLLIHVELLSFYHRLQIKGGFRLFGLLFTVARQFDPGIFRV